MWEVAVGPSLFISKMLSFEFELADIAKAYSWRPSSLVQLVKFEDVLQKVFTLCGPQRLCRRSFCRFSWVGRTLPNTSPAVAIYWRRCQPQRQPSSVNAANGDGLGFRTYTASCCFGLRQVLALQGQGRRCLCMGWLRRIGIPVYNCSCWRR